MTMGMDNQNLDEWYRGQTVFITGATGFLGKTIIEKLLRTTKVARMYLLVRPKKGKDVQQRIEDIFSEPIFNRLKKQVPDFMDTVSVVEGDVIVKSLGLNDLDRMALMEQVTTVIHGAATVKFDEKLKVAVSINVRGTKELLILCKQMKNLQSIVHVSTAYSYCVLTDIQEKFYNAPISGDNLIQLVECLSENQLESITDSIIGSWPNTYSFTKAVAEETVKTHGIGLPICIVRPSIVCPTMDEPIKGWVDNLYGPTGAFVAGTTGIMRTILVDGDCIADVVPVDLTSNCIIAAARHAEKSKTPDIPIFNYCSSKRNPIDWKNYIDMVYKWGQEYPTNKTVWYHSVTITKSIYLFKLYCLLYHILPALLIDIGLLAWSKKPRALKIYDKIHKFMNVLSYFTMKSFLFHDDNTRSLLSQLSKEDKNLFNFDITTVDWDDYLKDNAIGIREYIFKETEDSLKQARRKVFWFKILHYSIVYILYGVLAWSSYRMFNWMMPS